MLKNRRAIAAAVTTDGFPLHYRQSLDAVVQVYGVGFGLPDLILGQEGNLAWSYGGQKVALNPLNAYLKGAEATLFYDPQATRRRVLNILDR